MLLLLLLRGSRRLLGDCEQLRGHRRLTLCLHRLPLVLVPPTCVWCRWLLPLTEVGITISWLGLCWGALGWWLSFGLA